MRLLSDPTHELSDSQKALLAFEVILYTSRLTARKHFWRLKCGNIGRFRFGDGDGERNGERCGVSKFENLVTCVSYPTLKNGNLTVARSRLVF